MKPIKTILSAALAVIALTVSEGRCDPPTGRIIDGTPASVNDYPYVAQLLYEGSQLCTGTLVSSRHVLTAAHCFFDNRNRREVGDTDLLVRLGSQAVGSSRVFIHPAFRPRSQACVEGEVDAAVVELASAPAGVPAIPLLRSPVPIGSGVILAGFGTQGNGSQGEDGTLPPAGVINVGTTIVEGYGDNPPQQNTASTYFYWTFDPTESNTASGDSGGPAFLFDGQALSLAGITCGGTGSAEFGTLSFQTRSDVMAGWVDSIVGSAPSGTAPAFVGLTSQSASVGQAFSYAISVVSSDPVQLTASGLPDGLSLSGATISGVPLTAGAFTVQLQASSAGGSTGAQLTIVVSGFDPAVSVRRVLLQFDYTAGARDFLDIAGDLTVGPGFKPRGKIVTVRIGRFSKEFKMRADGASAGRGRSFFFFRGKLRRGALRSPTPKFVLTLEKVSIFDELGTLGFPSTVDASIGQEVPLPLTISIDGVETSTTALLRFGGRDRRWRLAD